MVEAAVSEHATSHSPAQLAAMHGLTAAGRRPSLTEYFGQLWRYRHFTISFANAASEATYKSTRLGQLWQIVTPLVNAAIYFVVFGVVLNTRSDVKNFIAHLCIGVFLFGFTQQVAMGGIKSISDNLNLIRALSFPRGSLPIAAVITHLKQMLASVAALLVIVLLTGQIPTVRWLLVIPILIMLTTFNVGFAMILARVGSKARDLKQLMPFVLRTWLYASGVFYGVSQLVRHLPDWLAKAVLANPMLVYIELTRNALLGADLVGYSDLTLWLIGITWAVVLVVAGYLFVWQGEKEYGRG